MLGLIRPTSIDQSELGILARSVHVQDQAIRRQAHQIARLETLTKELVAALESVRERQTDSKD